MEKYRCKLCLRKFANGRALGGHMRSHTMNLYATQKKERHQEEELQQAKDDQQQQLSTTVEFELVKSSISSSEDQEELEEKKSQGYVDPDECCFAVEAADSVVLQEGESETESSKNQHRFKRSKRIRKSRISNAHQSHVDHHVKEPTGYKSPKCSAKKGKPDDDSPASSISGTTPEEDVAYCLMMLSRDKWIKGKYQEGGNNDADEDQAEQQEQEPKMCVDNQIVGVVELEVTKTRRRGKSKTYACETCNKMFRSYQALGGHRASHKKIKVNNGTTASQEASQVVMETANGAPTATSVNVDKQFSRMIDLNLPPPLDNDDEDHGISHMELSTVSDAECANPIRQ